ncbi:hypothetical protein AB0D33_38045 [Streptomyces sp. NPDC048404]|uniref:hypothetical protein n=1 Tax=unclassified Streptomyces TaxID=2593676 RepID=UPI0034134178
MRSRRTLAYALLTSGILCGALGTYLHHPDLARVGVLLAVVAIPGYARLNHQASAEMIRRAELTGYMRALDHVARGLLDQNSTGQPGPGDRAELHADNVIPLYSTVPIRHPAPERQRKAL